MLPRTAREPGRQLAVGLLISSIVLVVLISSQATGSASGSPTVRPPPKAAGVPQSAVPMLCLPEALNGPGGPCPAAPHAASSTGGAGWVDLTSSAGNPPSPRSYTRSFAYDPVDGYLLTFGGYQAGTYAADTWIYNGSWHQLHPSVSPLGRDHSTLIWDPVDQYLLLFGGSGNGGDYSDTWTFVGGVWSKLSPQQHPSARWSSDVVWDTADGYALLFGGCAGAVVNDTWTFLGGNWTELSPPTSPEARQNVAMAFDSTMGKVVLFGGDDWYGEQNSDTWTFAAGQWTDLNLTVAPSGRSEASFVYDPSVHADVLFGGSTTAGIVGDTWWFVNGSWMQQHPAVAPDARYFGILAVYPPTESLVLWGGVGAGELTDTWGYYSVNLTLAAVALTGVAPFNATLSATSSGGYAPLSVSWTFGDGDTGSGYTVSHDYLFPGAYQAVATLTDANGVADSAGSWIQVLVPLSVSGVVAPLTGIAPLTVYASANSTGGLAPTTTRWDFGDLSNSSGSDSSFTFLGAGTYSVTLSVADAAGELRQEGWSILVSPAPHPILTGVLSVTPSIGLAPLVVDLTALAIGGAAPVSYAWDLGDGNTSSLQTLQHTYTSVGVFPVTVTITDAFGTAWSRSLNVEADPPLQAYAGALPGNGSAPLSVSFGATAYGGTPSYTFVWTFGDGNGSEGQTVTHIFANAGTYSVGLRVWDSLGARAADTLAVDVGAAPVHSHPPPAASNSTSASASQLSLPIALGVSVLVGVAAAVATAVVMRRRR